MLQLLFLLFSIILSFLLILLCTFPIPSPFVLHICVACGINFNSLHFIIMNRLQSFWLSNRVLLTLSRLTMANSINSFMDNMRLNTLNSLTHLLNSFDTDELNIIQHSPYISDEELIQSRIRVMNRLTILILYCQSLHAKFDYIKLLTEKFMSKNCPL